MSIIELLVYMVLVAAFGACLFGTFGAVAMYWAWGFFVLSMIAGFLSIGG